MSTSASGLLSRARGRSLTQIAKQGFGGWLLAVSTAAITGLQTFLDLLLTPIDLMLQLANASVNAFFLEPFGIITEGSEASAQGVAEFGVFGLIIAVLVVLGSIFIIAQFLERQDTTDVPIPGLLIDPPIPGIGVEEEEQED